MIIADHVLLFCTSAIVRENSQLLENLQPYYIIRCMVDGSIKHNWLVILVRYLRPLTIFCRVIIQALLTLECIVIICHFYQSFCRAIIMFKVDEVKVNTSSSMESSGRWIRALEA